MPEDYEIVTLQDGRRGYFYHTRFTGVYWFQPVDEDNCAIGPVEMPDESHEIDEFSPSNVTKEQWDAGAKSSDPDE